MSDSVSKDLSATGPHTSGQKYENFTRNSKDEIQIKNPGSNHGLNTMKKQDSGFQTSPTWLA